MQELYLSLLRHGYPESINSATVSSVQPYKTFYRIRTCPFKAVGAGGFQLLNWYMFRGQLTFEDSAFIQSHEFMYETKGDKKRIS